MNITDIKTEIEIKRDKILNEFNTRKNKDIVAQTGLNPSFISDVKAGRIILNYSKVIEISEKMGI